MSIILSMKEEYALNDPALDINWKTGSTIPVISEKDLKHPLFEGC